jgi:hypothetical protein
MKPAILTSYGPGARLLAMTGRKLLLAAMVPVMLGGCVQVSAPDKPIEINLNVNIRQEVVLSLREDARELIQANPGVF